MKLNIGENIKRLRREKDNAEITALGERIMKYCPDQDIRLEATGRLAFNHCEMGRKEMGRLLPDDQLILVYEKMQAFLQLMYDGNETDNNRGKYPGSARISTPATPDPSGKL